MLVYTATKLLHRDICNTNTNLITIKITPTIIIKILTTKLYKLYNHMLDKSRTLNKINYMLDKSRTLKKINNLFNAK